VRVLERLGHRVLYDPGQTCCGQALFNAGFRPEARQLAIKFLRRFGDAQVVVAPSGSCVAMARQHYADLGLEPADRTRWEALRDRVWELSSFLVDCLGVVDVGAAFPHRVSYHPSCHLLRSLGVREQPLKLLEAVRGLELAARDLPAECCGFGGVFSVKYPALADAIADRRAAALAGTGADFIIGADDSCLRHLQNALQRLGAAQRTMHLACVLASERET
jgi:L-lactate dehydrogenase complex protein LldE